jgi:glycerol-3-phosphate dehydrogenase
MTDVIIIGAGVTGAAVARYLSRYKADICVLERESDVCAGTTKANSAIVHAGHDAKPGTLKARFNIEGSEMMEDLSRELDIPYKRNGSLVVCHKGQDASGLNKLLEKGKANGVKDLRIIEKEELHRLEPSLSDDCESALFAPTGAIICPFTLNIALAENACTNGVRFYFNCEVTDVIFTGDHYKVTTGRGVFEAKAVVNAAGVYADVINNMVSEKKYHITPRKGQYLLLDRNTSPVSHTIFSLPTKMGKGVLVTPTVHGNTLIGPTAEDIPDKEDTSTTSNSLDYIRKSAAAAVDGIPFHEVITSFAGLRAHEDGGDFVIGEAADKPLFFNALGIESPGLTSAPAIGKYLSDLISERLGLPENPEYDPDREGIVDPSSLSVEERNELIKRDPSYGQIICRCEMISEGEIKSAINRPLGARTLDGIKIRTRAGMGRCQAGFCTPKVMEILEKEAPMSIFDVTKSGGESHIVSGYNKRV